MKLKEAYKLGFLFKCAEAGVSPTQLEEAINKTAQLETVGKALEGVSATGKNLALFVGLPLVAGAGLLGAGSAYLRYAVDDKSNNDIVDLQDAQIIHTLSNLTEQAKQRRKFLADLNKRKKVYTGRW